MSRVRVPLSAFKGQLAQLVEHLAFNQGVVGSNPSLPTRTHEMTNKRTLNKKFDLTSEEFVDLDDIKKLNIRDLKDLCLLKGILPASRNQMILELLKALILEKRIITSGVLDIGNNNNYGFLRDIKNNFLVTPYDIYIPATFIKDRGLKAGDEIRCIVLQPRNEEKYFTLSEVISINGREDVLKRMNFEDMTATYPTRQIKLESSDENVSSTTRILDLITPIGFGNRGLIAAQPKSGKTTVMHSIAKAIIENYSKTKLIILLIDERPEEVTEMQKIAPTAEIVYSTFDSPLENHIKVSEMTVTRAKRLVELGEDVVILMDSLTRLTRANNAATPSSGKILSGGIEPSALYKPKNFFGAARNTEEGGSLTIIATVLIETGSKMDDYIFEEFYGTGNCVIYLRRDFANKRIFPAIDIVESGTRRTELMLDPNLVPRINMLNMVLRNDGATEGLRKLKEQISRTVNNNSLLAKLTG
jgi:transcription termination factor Rho